MIVLTSLEIYNSFVNITKENNKFEIFKFLDEESGGISYSKVGGENEKNL